MVTKDPMVPFLVGVLTAAVTDGELIKVQALRLDLNDGRFWLKLASGKAFTVSVKECRDQEFPEDANWR